MQCGHAMDSMTYLTLCNFSSFLTILSDLADTNTGWYKVSYILRESTGLLVSLKYLVSCDALS